MGHTAVKNAAMMEALGLDGWAYLTCEDPAEVTVREGLLELAADIDEKKRKNLAVEIANSVGKLFKR